MRLADRLWIDLCGKARGDCWWLVAEVYRRMGRQIVGFDAERFDDWKKCAPEPGAVVLFVRNGRAHVGVMLDEREYVHAAKGRVFVSRIASLRRANVAYRCLRHEGVGLAPVAPAATGVRVVYVPDPVGRPAERQTWYRAPGTIGECAPAGANVVMTADGPRIVAEVADRPAPSSVVYATAPEGIETGTVALIGLILSVVSAVLTILLTPKPQDAKQDDPYSTYDGIRNTAASGIVQPVVYGAHRTAGNFISAVQRVDADGRSVFYGLIFLSRGPVQSVGGLTSDADELTGPEIPDSIEIDGNPARNYDCKVSVRLGGYDQNTVPGFNETASTVSQTAALVYAAPFGYTTSQAVTGFDALVTYPAGLFGVTSSGAYQTKTVTHTVRWRVNGTSTWSSASWDHASARNAQVSFQFSKRGLTKDIYEIQVERTTTADNTTSEQSASNMLAVNEVVAEGFTYPGCALLGVRLVGSDQLAGGVPTITCQVEGRKVWVYDGAGGFTQTYTRNPAWIALDILTSKDYGLGRGGRVTLDAINIDEFDDFADWCDELVDDGRGGTVARAQCDYVASEEQSGWDLAREIVESAFGKLYFAGGQARIWIDGATSPTFMFTAGNSREVKVSYLGKRDRSNAAEVQYLNAETDYERDYANRLDDSSVLTGADTIRKATVGGAGITRAAQAYRMAQRLVNQARYVKRRFSWVSGPESIHLKPGDVAYLHGSALGVGQGGRILDATSSTVKLDRTITATTRVRLDVYAQDDSAPTVVYVNSGTYARNTAITIRDSGGSATTWSATPAAGSKWIIASLTASATEPIAVRIEKVSTNDVLDMTFEGSEYVADVYDDDPGDVEEFTDELPDPREMPTSVTGLRASDATLTSCDGSVSDAIRVAFQTVEKWQTAEVWYRVQGSTSWTFHGWSRGDALIPVACGTYEVAVAARSARGTLQRIDDAARAFVVVRGVRTPPAAPSAASVAITLGRATVTITPPSDATAIAGYEIRAYGDTWAGARTLGKTSTTTWFGSVPDVGTFRVQVRSYSWLGVYSATGASSTSVTHTVAESAYTQDISSNEHTGWTGTKSSTAVTGSELQLSGANTGSYVTADKSTVVTKEAQELRIALGSDLADVAMTWDEATYSWGGTLGTALTWGTAYLSGREVTEIDSLTWDQAGFTWDGLQASLRTWAGPTDVIASLAPLLEYDVNTGAGFSGSYTTYTEPITVANLTGTRVRAKLNRPHDRYDPRLVTLTTNTLIVGGSEPERETVEFLSATATAVNARTVGILNSTAGTSTLKVPASKKLVILRIEGRLQTGATAGTYDVYFILRNVTDASDVVLSSAAAAANTSIWATSEGTRVAPIGTLSAGKEWQIGWLNRATSPGALSGGAHNVRIVFIYEDV